MIKYQWTKGGVGHVTKATDLESLSTQIFAQGWSSLTDYAFWSDYVLELMHKLTQSFSEYFHVMTAIQTWEAVAHKQELNF